MTARSTQQSDAMGSQEKRQSRRRGGATPFLDGIDEQRQRGSGRCEGVENPDEECGRSIRLLINWRCLTPCP